MSLDGFEKLAPTLAAAARMGAINAGEHVPPTRLDTSDERTFVAWAMSGDGRTLEEFAEDGGASRLQLDEWTECQLGALIDLRSKRPPAWGVDRTRSRGTR